MTFKSTKTYGHDIGLSCAFRQWKAPSHCRFIHGYALSVRLEFAAEELDHLNWVVDFGNLKPLKQKIVDTFDHKLIVAQDDPMLTELIALQGFGLAEVVILPHTGCERFAEHIANMAREWLVEAGYSPRCRLSKVEVAEHGANSAIWEPSGVNVAIDVDASFVDGMIAKRFDDFMRNPGPRKR